MQKKYINTKEVCEAYGFKLKTLYMWVAANRIPHYRINGVIMFSPEKLDNWLAKKEVKVRAV